MLQLCLAFLEHLERDRKNSARTRNARLAAIHAFFRFLEYRLAVQPRPVPPDPCHSNEKN